ncbi:MAG: hypothetical protein ACPL06_00535 [Candidatus Anstonellales archaeon]
MGIFENIKGMFGKKESVEQHGAVRMKARFVPLHAFKHRDGKVSLIVNVSNETPTEKLVSLEVFIDPKAFLGFNTTCTHKNAEKKLGTLKPGETREEHFTIYSTSQTKEGEYDVRVNANIHYLDYDKIESQIKKSLRFKVV